MLSEQRTSAAAAARRLGQLCAQLQPAPAASAHAGSVAAGRSQWLKQPMIVREAEPSEYDRVVVVVNSAFGHWASHYTDAHWQRLSVDKLREELVQGRELGLASELLVCVDAQGNVYGTVLTNQWYAAEDFASAGRPDTASFGQLAVVPQAQGHGVGAMLVRACENRARARGKRRMDICFVSPDVGDLLPFYTALGYERGETGYPSSTSRLRPVSAQFRAVLHRVKSASGCL